MSLLRVVISQNAALQSFTMKALAWAMLSIPHGNDV